MKKLMVLLAVLAGLFALEAFNMHVLLSKYPLEYYYTFNGMFAVTWLCTLETALAWPIVGKAVDYITEEQ